MNIANPIELQAFLRPDKIAVVFGEAQYSYGEMDAQANRVANALISMGIQKGDRVAMWLPNRFEFLIAFYGIAKIGAVALPMNILYKEREIQFLLSNSQSKAIIALEEGLTTLRQVRENLPDLKKIIVVGQEKGYDDAVGFEKRIAAHSNQFISLNLSPDDPATILYTSGTTGNPKGAVLTHYNLLMNSEFYAVGLGTNEDWVGICVLPLSHLLSLAAGVMVLFGKGATMHVMDRFVAEEAGEIISRHRVNYSFAVRTVYTLLLALPDEPRFDLTSLEVCIVTGAVTPLELRKEFEEKFTCKTIHAYAQVESSPVITMDRIDMKRKFESVGYPLPHIEVKIVDDEDRSLPPNEHGEICCKGHCVMKEYWDNPVGTASTIIDGWLHTGDIGMLDEEGYLYIFDRKKDMIICGGYNIYPIELEELLYENPKVLEAAVIGIPDDKMGEIPKAYISLKPGQTANEEEMMAYVRERLAKYKKLRSVEFLSEVPKGPTGKILRRELRELSAKK
ncbi:MAG: long-chain-fatty-acid--CoA ligase [Deltaproteobacteria bacterium]|nr:long-chain-fatty-acid--CoA ligase [Deltaproteobacteria bacterium]